MLRSMLAILVACLASCVAMEPLPVFQPLTSQDGVKTFRFVGPWALNSDSAGLANAVAAGNGEHHWCPAGWNEVSRQKVSGQLLIEGRCKT